MLNRQDNSRILASSIKAIYSATGVRPGEAADDVLSVASGIRDPRGGFDWFGNADRRRPSHAQSCPCVSMARMPAARVESHSVGFAHPFSRIRSSSNIRSILASRLISDFVLCGSTDGLSCLLAQITKSNCPRKGVEGYSAIHALTDANMICG